MSVQKGMCCWRVLRSWLQFAEGIGSPCGTDERCMHRGLYRLAEPSVRGSIPNPGWRANLGLWLAVMSMSVTIVAGPRGVTAQSVFRVVSEIQLAEDQPLGSIRYIDLSSGGRILVSDASVSEAHLFDRDGSFVRSLDPQPATPAWNGWYCVPSMSSRTESWP